MRFVKISQEEILATRKLYESVMSYACHGLFHREGKAVGRGVADIALKNPSEYFETTKNILVGRGWVQEMVFDGTTVTARGSIEVVPGSDTETCHRLQGILAMIYEAERGERLVCVEEECESTGADKCLFRIEREA
jgi:predicted hydrocarbon binding protein